jgi:hypothetical protein
MLVLYQTAEAQAAQPISKAGSVAEQPLELSWRSPPQGQSEPELLPLPYRQFLVG